MSRINPKDYISGGYFITRRVPREGGLGEGLLPDTFVTASECLCPHIPDISLLAWVGGQEERMVRIVSDYRLPLGALDMLVDWMTQEYEREVGHTSIFYRLETAWAITRNFFPNRADLLVCGIGLHRSLAGLFLSETRPPGYGTGLRPEAPLGTYKSILSGLPLAGGGVPLGYELLCYDPHANELGCSWLCNGLERDFNDMFDLWPNESGLIDDYEAAIRCAGAIRHGELSSEPEPGLWLPWLLVSYPVETNF